MSSAYKNAVIVGGGMAGILAALLLKDRYETVTLIEKSPHIGGLLNSLHGPDGDAVH